MKHMHISICKYTCILSAIVSLPVLLFSGLLGLVGVWMGTLMALVGYTFIVKLSASIQPDFDASKKTVMGYLFRYVFYAAVMMVGVSLQIPVMTILLGYLSHKISLLMYTWLERRNVNGPTN